MHQPNHGANSSAAAVTRTSFRRLSQPYIPSTVHHSSSPGSVIYAGTTFAARRSGAITEFWQPTALSAANSGEKDAANRKGNRVQLHALYLILCVVLFNMVALLSIVHFKLLLVVSPDGISGTNSSDFVAPSPLLKARHREGKRRVAVANADGREKSLLLSSFEQLAANTKGIGRRKPQFQHQTVETNIANGSSHDDLRQLRKSGSHQDKREDGGDNADNKTKIGTGILRQTPLAKVGYRLSKAPAEQETSETTEPYTADMPSHSQQLMRAFPACSGCLQPIVPASQLEGQQLLVDCRTEEDAQGSQKCVGWRKAGFCQSHPATRWLFCRRECLCTSNERRQ